MPELTAQHDGIRLCYQRIGDAGAPLLLISGLAADMHYWNDDFCAALVNNGFHVARFDNRDAGRSTRLDGLGAPSRRAARRDPATAPYQLEDMAADAIAVLDALGWASAHIAGHSIGAIIAQRLAIDCPSRAVTHLHQHDTAPRRRPVEREDDVGPVVGCARRVDPKAAARAGRGRRTAGAPAPRDRLARVSAR
ncbi:alpha/beta fold hydrolase [Mycobacterium genavense]|uniref:alpha/beta fold hydrolase n=1 Tax=Mycobacterium genavense TaxID=36812 RepID=UPI003CCBA488